ncbi:Putative uncharacterized protein OS=Mesorhizobium alhagi CCNWXJ12-2 GN=MAXJ12_25723 PE=4 SV=1 [Gemmataceae bacterium]|nr:Putative uncharacterized protein OS=Mesorhizobium alhagi CCNWXJ12-2 GN=MAXJ12_25723 PE=4 SV=1 [Gemmataceae bacterium]VTT98806.1 Putative uncharacterized protein OS=Mesorhizobium alhagi CCNWXJ12-2 GN=MAXJ12_25723 PE=4 SV=1 [Gemmataceae bacterium]
MSASALLLWLSARRQGTWAQFKAAVEELHAPDEGEANEAVAAVEEEPDIVPLYQQLRWNLERLAHTEFEAEEGEIRWRIVPPTLAMSRTDEEGWWEGLLCGARSPKLLDRVERAAHGLVELRTEESPGAPRAYRVYGEQVAVRSFATDVGLGVQVDAPLAVLSGLPPIDDRVMRRAQEVPMGSEWRVQRFSIESLRWQDSTREAALEAREDLFRFRLPYRLSCFYCTRRRSFAIPTQIGKYLLLRKSRRRMLQYDESVRTLTVPAICRPPALIERALVLHSGCLPRFASEASTLTYTRIPPAAASLVARLLCQEV